MEDFVVVVEKEKRKPSRSQDRVGGKTEKPKSKKTVEVVVEVEQTRRRSTRNSLEGVNGGQASNEASTSQGNPEKTKTAASENSEKNSATGAKKNSNRRKLVEGSSQELKELKEKAKKSKRYAFGSFF